MNWNLILKLSLVSVVIALAGVFYNIEDLEVWLWLALFAVAAVAIAKQTSDKRFFHGFMLGVICTAITTIIHVVFLSQYLITNEENYKQITNLPKGITIRSAIIMMSFFVALGSGLIAGVLAWMAGMVIKKADS